MIDLKRISKLSPAKDVAEFMAEFGGSHVRLYAGWKARPEMGALSSALEQQLSISVRSQNFHLSKRILGRLRKVHSDEENTILGRLCNVTEPEPIDLGCLG